MLLREPTYVMVVALNENDDVLGRIYGHVLHRFEATDLLLYEVDVAECASAQGCRPRDGGIPQGLRPRARLSRDVGADGDPQLRRQPLLSCGIGGMLENAPANMYVFQDRAAMIATLLSTVFGIGYVRFAPGTVASAVALPFGWLILWKFGPVALAFSQHRRVPDRRLVDGCL